MSGSIGKRALVIGASGFVGGHLLAHLQSLGWELFATKLPKESIAAAEVKVYNLDILDAGATKQIVGDILPDYTFHLAAQSSVGLSWKEPALTANINVVGAINVLEAVRSMKKPSRLLLIGSSEEYGRVRPEEVPVREDTPLRPGNIYAVTKAAQNMLGKIYADAYGMDVLMIRAFNHIGPGQGLGFVVPDFCYQIARIEEGLSEPVLYVGNLTAERDFTDVRDIVRAYSLLAQRGKPGALYNVGRGKATSIQSILDALVAQARLQITVERDEARFRPVDMPLVTADTTVLCRDTGWTAERKLVDSLEDTLEYWRGHVKNADRHSLGEA